MTHADQTVRAGLTRELTYAIETLTPHASRGAIVPPVTVQKLVALLVACRAEFGGAPSAPMIDLSAAEYSTGIRS